MLIPKSRPCGRDGSIDGSGPLPATRERSEAHCYAEVKQQSPTNEAVSLYGSVQVSKNNLIQHLALTRPFYSSDFTAVLQAARCRHSSVLAKA